jgi:TetR/AcrR family transcriptional regulator
MDAAVQNRRLGLPRSGIAERIWDAARSEFSRRGYHGARVQGIARGASCNVALMYRHWSSKRALYLDVLRAVWLRAANDISRVIADGDAGPSAFVGAFLDAMMKDPMGAQILVREYLDGAPCLSELAAADPAILDPVRRASGSLPPSDGSAADPILALVTIGGLAALVASAREATRPFIAEPIAPEAWRRHVFELLVKGLAPPRDGAASSSGVAGR